MIEPLDFPKADLKLKRRDDQLYVWCIVRKKELLLTPEEWVRQHAIHYLINECAIPLGLIASEMTVEYNGMQKRADIVVFNRDQTPVMIVECKATSVPITEKTLRQIAQYNFDLNVDYLFLTNGNQHVYCRVDKESGKLVYMKNLPNILSDS
ncbi:MAG: type I restriction enzyme HsdR N-terminal domain-containing protein [Crocinitomicaceae bacterium]|nr:type I restriction enzyme HsdR N-terminal domain-containing protein [Crocinitomicaceae bacterium]